MAHGIRTRDGGDPLLAWAGRIHWFGDARMTSTLTHLLGGERVLAEVGVLELS